MQIHFRPPKHGHPGLISEAEIHFEKGPLVGMRLVGFSVWRTAEGQLYVTFPSRTKGVGAERRHVEYLRSVGSDPETVRRVKAWIRGEYCKRSAASA